jgi:NAD(P)-dependent dehydrogenase (short-subunit alcohol dehydrogenase family)
VGRLENKVAIVTGAGQGIGKGVALAFASEGARIVIAELNPSTAATAGDEVRARGVDVLVVPADVRERSAAERVTAAALAEFGDIDILVNNAIANVPAAPLEEVTDDHVRLALECGLMGTLYFMQACFPHMKGRGGKIINFGSTAGVDGMAYMGPYSVTKEAIRTLTKVAAREWGQHKIFVNAVCPFGASPGYEEWAKSDPEMIASIVASQPLHRGAGDCELDIGRALVFLASSDSDFVTGHTLFVDGGQNIR